ncbi:hypothetical protein PMAYCL1PPCAC_14946, partial [Pristionchus mayeri]
VIASIVNSVRKVNIDVVPSTIYSSSSYSGRTFVSAVLTSLDLSSVNMYVVRTTKFGVETSRHMMHTVAGQGGG